ncbi:MAG: hypothetical protein M0020_00505 [Actinomycetota bacterium]|nr:hypothetical protein [Actinomycetota bacterium]
MSVRRPIVMTVVSALARSAAAVGLALVLIASAGTPDAWAAGSPRLDPYIISNPEPGWIKAPASALQSSLSSLTANLSKSLGARITSAGGEWASPTTGEALLILIFRMPNTIPNPGQRSKTAADAECATATGTVSSTASVPSVSGSTEIVCASGSGVTMHAIWFIRNNTLVNLTYVSLSSASALGSSSSRLAAIAARENAAVPSSGIDPPSTGLGVGILIGIGVGVLLIVVGIILFSVRRSRRSLALAPAPAPGAMAGDPWGPQGTGWGSVPVGTWSVPATGTGVPESSPVGQPGVPLGATQSGPLPFQGSGSQAPAIGSLPSFETVMGRLTSDDEVAQVETAPGGKETTPTAGGGTSESPAPAGDAVPDAERPVGWHPVEGDPQHQRYWDGTTWTSTIRWDGAAWIDSE